jgi:hypothetical protein
MAHILTADQAANALRVPNTDPRLTDLLPQVDLFIERATGRDWAQDTQKNQIAVMAATILMVMAYDNPSMVLPGADVPFGLTSTLAQLEAEALRYRSYLFHGISAPGYIGIPGARLGDEVISLTGVWGVTGDQSAKFEAVVNYRDSLKQISSENLVYSQFVVILKNPADDILP